MSGMTTCSLQSSWYPDTKTCKQFGALLPIELTNEEIRNSNAYKEYYAVATGVAPPKHKGSIRETRSSSDTAITPPTATVGPRLTSSAKGKQAAKASKAKSLFALFENSTDEEGDDDEGNDGDDGEEGDDDDDDQEVVRDDEKDDEEECGDDEQAPIPHTTALSSLIQDLPNFSLLIVHRYMDQKMNKAVQVAVQSDKLRVEAQKENDDFLKTINENMQKIIKEQVKEQVKLSLLEAEVLTRSFNLSKTSYVVAADL
nr:hypothetical protein [Tanacetum cinerariifolium]